MLSTPRTRPPAQPELVTEGPPRRGAASPPTLTCLGQGDLLHVGDGRGLVHVLRQVLLLLLTVPTLGFVVGGGGSAKGETPTSPSPPHPRAGLPHPIPCPGCNPAAPPQPRLTPSSRSSSWPRGWARGRASAFASCNCPPSCPAGLSRGCSPGRGGDRGALGPTEWDSQAETPHRRLPSMALPPRSDLIRQRFGRDLLPAGDRALLVRHLVVLLVHPLVEGVRVQDPLGVDLPGRRGGASGSQRAGEGAAATVPAWGTPSPSGASPASGRPPRRPQSHWRGSRCHSCGRRGTG